MPAIAKILVISICYLLVDLEISSQDINLGFELGLGRSTTEPKTSVLGELLSFPKDDNLRLQLNSIIEFIPKFSMLSIYSGIGYSQKGSESINLHYLSCPLACKLIFGKSLRPYLGGGVFISLLLHSEDNYPDGYSKAYSDFDLGGFLNIGIRYEVNTEFSLFLDYKNYISGSDVYVLAKHNNYRNIAHYLHIGAMFNLYRHN